MGVYKYRDVINIKAADEIICISPDAKNLSRSEGCIPAAFSGLRFHKIRSTPWEASRMAMALPRCPRPMNPAFMNDDGERRILNGCGSLIIQGKMSKQASDIETLLEI